MIFAYVELYLASTEIFFEDFSVVCIMESGQYICTNNFIANSWLVNNS